MLPDRCRSLNDVVGFINIVADSILVYKVCYPTSRAMELADNLVRATIDVENAVSQLRRWAEREKILPLCVGINRLENTDDWVFRIAMGEFFDYDIDIARVIKWRGIYENAESPTARCEDVANIIEGVALKHA